MNRISGILTVRLITLGLASALAAALPPRANAGDPPRTDARMMLERLIRSQDAKGYFAFTPADSMLARLPITASLCWRIYRGSGDRAFLSEAYAALDRYYLTMGHDQDQDTDKLMESPAAGGLEDVGFNCLLALDMTSQARIALELRKPAEGLLWYEEAKAIEAAIIDKLYRYEANYFFPFNNATGSVEYRFFALSLLPTLFPSRVGENIGLAMIKHYLLRTRYLSPETPHTFLTLSSATLVPEDDLFKASLLLEVLHRNGLCREEQEARAAVLANLSTQKAGPSHGPLWFLARDMIEQESYLDLFPVVPESDLLCGLVRWLRPLGDVAIIRLERSTDALRKLFQLHCGLPSIRNSSEEETRASIRSLYQIISQIREHIRDPRTGRLWRDEAYFGSGLGSAAEALCRDVVAAVHRAEDILSQREADSLGLDMTCIVTKEKILPPARVKLNVNLRAKGRTLTLRALNLEKSTGRRALLRSRTFTVAPGDTQASFPFSLLLPPSPPGLVTFEVPVRVVLEGGRSLLRYFRRSAYLARPVEITALFPDGRILTGSSVPIEVLVTKPVGRGLSLSAYFYSPSGLELKGGPRQRLLCPPGQGRVSFRLNVTVPQPSRPGSFPFILRIYQGSETLASIEDRLFRPYHWLYLGPFPGGREPAPRLAGRSVDVLETFQVDGQRLGWRELEDYASGSRGEIRLRRLLPVGATSYLYTVLGSREGKDCTLVLSSSDPVTVFLNGARCAVIPQGGSTVRKKVSLRRGLNEVLLIVKRIGSGEFYFDLGEGQDLAADDIGNNLWELAEGYALLQKKDSSGAVSKVVTLTYRNPQAHSVSVVGSFNGWSPESSPMRRVGRGRWEITLHLPPGRYAYKFLVNNRTQVLDPSCPFQESDGYGGKNSVLFVR